MSSVLGAPRRRSMRSNSSSDRNIRLAMQEAIGVMLRHHASDRDRQFAIRDLELAIQLLDAGILKRRQEAGR